MFCIPCAEGCVQDAVDRGWLRTNRDAQTSKVGHLYFGLVAELHASFGSILVLRSQCGVRNTCVTDVGVLH